MMVAMNCFLEYGRRGYTSSNPRVWRRGRRVAATPRSSATEAEHTAHRGAVRRCAIPSTTWHWAASTVTEPRSSSCRRAARGVRALFLSGGGMVGDSAWSGGARWAGSAMCRWARGEPSARMWCEGATRLAPLGVCARPKSQSDRQVRRLQPVLGPNGRITRKGS